MSFINRYDIPAIAVGGVYCLYAFGKEVQFQSDAPAVSAKLEMDLMRNGRNMADRLPVGTGYTFKSKQNFEQINIFNRGAAATAAFTLLVIDGVEAGTR